MKFLLWPLRILVFIALFGLAIKNSGSVELRFFFNQIWLTPLSLALLLAFVLGVLVGMTGFSATYVAQRREISRLKHEGGGSTSAH